MTIFTASSLNACVNTARGIFCILTPPFGILTQLKVSIKPIIAQQETVDVIGISTYCGGELALGGRILKIADERGIKDYTTFLIGGIFPPKDIPQLREIGFDGVFLSATKDEIVSCIQNNVAEKGKKLWASDQTAAKSA
jgi:methylmalonyl-CoA mutase cobalamin-binding domain/chain